MANFPNNSWKSIFENAKTNGLFDSVTQQIQADRQNGKIIFPPSKDIFRAFELCDLDNLKLVFLGQDPYHGSGEANGLCFSVHQGIRIPPSLRNIFQELKQEYPDFNLQRTTDLSDWARQGVLLLNTVLTVEKDKPASHSAYGWQSFTDYIITEISNRKDFVVFMLLGNFAKTKIPLINSEKHSIVTAAHPSPFSAHKGFLGSGVFQKSNELLLNNSLPTIQW